jgi:twitching motility protein PilT
MPWIDSLLETMVARKSSDLHMVADSRPYMRVHGDIEPVEGHAVLTDAENREILLEIMPAANRLQFEQTGDTDFAYEIAGKARFRVNVFVDRFGAGGVFRCIPSVAPTADQLNLPKVVRDFAMLTKGMVVITGPTGSGKSTTLAAIIDLINRTRKDHIITIEDPIEFVHRPIRCLVDQREVHKHTRSFAAALRAALREDPDVVLVGEMRDLETMEIALETAETGHLVFGTLHTNTAASTVDRIIDMFPSDQQNHIRTILADCLRGVVAQTLCRRRGGGRVAAMEVLIVTTGVAGNIRDGKTHQIPSAMQIGRGLGMCSFEESLFALVEAGEITTREAYLRAISKDAISRKIREAGLPLDVSVQDAGPEELVASHDVSAEEGICRLQDVLRQNPDDVGALSDLAWLLATAGNHGSRRGKDAVKHAERANTLSKGMDIRVFVVLAASYAEAGNIRKAVTLAAQAKSMAETAGRDDLAQLVRRHLELYEAGKALP